MTPVKVSRTIRQQVSQITAGVTALVLGVTLFVVVYVSQQNALSQAIGQAEIIARVIGSNVTASIAFRDPATAGELLDALAVSPEILRARVYLDDGTPFAEYQAESSQGRVAEASTMTGSAIDSSSYIKEIVTPIILGGTEIGTIVVWLDSWPYQYQIYLGLVFALVVWLIGAIIAYVLAQRLNERVTRPINDLSNLMVRVSSYEDYSSRFEHHENNEIALLGASFNQMLGQIEDREQRLQEVIRALEDARDDAQEAARSKSSFLANMSHEIRTPMNGVVGMISLLQRTELNDQQRLYFDTIDKSASSLLMIIDDILDFTKIEAGRLEVKSEPLSLQDNLNSIAAFFDEPARHKGIAFGIASDPNIPDKILGDSGRLRQVLLNLLGNAMKFTEHGSVRLNVVSAGDPIARRIRFEVSDTGIGIAPRDQQRIFSEFFQADVTSTRQFGGTGLGLAICRQLVTLMGGNIGFHSALGVGSTFWFELPLQAEVINPFELTASSPTQAPSNPFLTVEESAEANVSDEETNGQQAGPLAGGHQDPLRFEANVLVAEDSEVNQFIIRELLATMGIKPVIVNNGQEAVESFQSHRFDLVFMDIQMPIMDGVVATRILRELQARQGVNPSCFVVGLSAHAMSGDRERYLQEGMDDYLTKPISITDLERVLRDLLRPVNDMILWR